MSLSPEQAAQLQDTLSCTEAELNDRLMCCAIAARQEYVALMLGDHVFTRIQDLREYRLLLLIRELFKDTLPAERKVSAMLQTTTAESRTLLRSVHTKHRLELGKALVVALSALLRTAKPLPGGSGDLVLAIYNVSIVEEINSRLLDAGPELRHLKKRQRTGAQFEISEASYRRLRIRELLELAPPPTGTGVAARWHLNSDGSSTEKEMKDFTEEVNDFVEQENNRIKEEDDHVHAGRKRFRKGGSGLPLFDDVSLRGAQLEITAPLYGPLRSWCGLPPSAR